MYDIIIYVLLGLSVGYIGGYAGIGGGPFLVSFLVIVMGMSQLMAQGNILTMMLGPMSLLGVLSLYGYVKKLWGSIIVGVFAYCLFSYFGAIGAFYLGEIHLSTYFAILLIVIAAIQISTLRSKKNNSNSQEVEHVSLLWVFTLAAVTGIFGGLFGIGAGVLMIPVLTILLKLKKEFARALSLSILIPPVSYGAFIKYNAELSINWQLVSILFFSYFIANYFGTKKGSKASKKVFTSIYSIILLSIAFIYLIK